MFYPILVAALFLEVTSAFGGEMNISSKSPALAELLASHRQDNDLDVQILADAIIWKTRVGCFSDVMQVKQSDLDFSKATAQTNLKNKKESWISIPCRTGECVKETFGSAAWPADGCKSSPDNKSQTSKEFAPPSFKTELVQKLLSEIRASK